MSKLYKLPNGIQTEDAQLYYETYDEIIKELEKKLDVVVYGFDPGFSVYDVNNNRVTANIPMWLAERIIE